MRPIFLFLFPLLLLSAACDNSFSPKTDYNDRIVVFCILDRDAPQQIVRLESTYDAELTSPDKPVGKKDIEQAVVSIRNDAGVHTFRDTVITMQDGSSKKIWVNNTLRPVEGREYILLVDVPGYERISARATVPSRAFLLMQSADGGVRLSAVQNVAAPPTAYYFRMWVVGTRTEGGVSTEVRREVPLRYNSITGEYEYGGPSRQALEFFPTGGIVHAQGLLRDLDGVVGRDVVATAYSLDQYLYSYYQLARGFDDPTSYRLDKPDITNIVNGVGIFGAMVSDSVKARYNIIVQ
jgi:hypothetical protein